MQFIKLFTDDKICSHHHRMLVCMLGYLSGGIIFTFHT